jgi:hypothetical protein
MLGQPSLSDYAALPGRLYRPRRAPAPSELTRTYQGSDDRPNSFSAQGLEGIDQPELGLGNVPSEPGDQGPEGLLSSKVLGLSRCHLVSWVYARRPSLLSCPVSRPDCRTSRGPALARA